MRRTSTNHPVDSDVMALSDSIRVDTGRILYLMSEDCSSWRDNKTLFNNNGILCSFLTVERYMFVYLLLVELDSLGILLMIAGQTCCLYTLPLITTEISRQEI
jgi:hypothetical protein